MGHQYFLNNQFNMYKFALLLTLVLIGASGKNLSRNGDGFGLENGGQHCWAGCNSQQGKCAWCGTDGWCCKKGWTGNGCDGTFGGSNHHLCVLKPSEEDLQKIIDLVLCSCDDGDYDHQLSIEEYTSPVCKAIGFHLFDHENSADDFDFIDTNGDGVATFEEIFNSAMDAVPAGRKFTPAFTVLSGEEHAVQAAVHVLGCACDSNGSFTIDSEEANADECQAVQEWVFGQGQSWILGEYFPMFDQDSNGEIDGQEAIDAINYIIEHINQFY